MGDFAGSVLQARSRPVQPAVADPAAAAELDRLQTIFRLAPVGIGLVDPTGRTVMANETLRLLLGYSEEEFAEMAWEDYTHPDDIAENVELYARMVAGETDQFSLEKRFVCKNGRIMWALLTSSVVRTPDGAPQYQIGMVQDITDRKHLEHELRTAEQHYRMLVERVPAVVYVADVGPAARWHYVSPQIEGMLGFSPADWTADPDLWLRQVHPDDRERVLDAEQWVVSQQSDAPTYSGRYRIHRRDGSMLWVRDEAIRQLAPDGSVTWHGVIFDVTREKQLEDRLSHQASHDPLTGLPNRPHFHASVGRALERSADTGGSVAVLFVDLDRFKTVNDSFGHAYGDEVIVAAAQRISSCARPTDVAARLGGDEFALLVADLDVAEVEALADRVLEALRRAPMRLGDLTVTVGASIGIALAEAGESTDTLLRNADLAMYRAKRQGRGRHFRYEEDLHDEVVSRFRIEEALHAAVTAGKIGVAYQPIVDTRTGDVVGLEALARWTDPELGVVGPDIFVAVAERTGLVKDLGRQVLRKACDGLVQWRARTGADAYVSVNVSALQLDDDFADTVGSVLDGAGLDPRALVLEITESLLLTASGRDAIRGLRQRGVRVAIDDFGTGYSSLSYLRDLPVDMIKIDQVFLRPGPDGVEDQVVLRALIALTHSLQLTTICEGVETLAHLEELRSSRCGYAQGYLLSRPTTLEAIPARIEVVEDDSVPALF